MDVAAGGGMRAVRKCPSHSRHVPSLHVKPQPPWLSTRSALIHEAQPEASLCFTGLKHSKQFKCTKLQLCIQYNVATSDSPSHLDLGEP